jgi:hypothetical protein
MIWRFLLIGLLLFGCTENQAKFDGSSEGKFRESLGKVKGTLTAEQTEKLQTSLQVLAFSDMADAPGGILGAVAKLSADPNALVDDVRLAVNGKTAAEVIALADEKIRERQLKELKSIEAEINELEAKKTEAEQAGHLLSKIVISSPKFYWRDQKYRSEPIIEFTVKNNTDIALSRIFYHGTVSTPGRSIPWIDEEFNNTISGGIEPGETREIGLAPNLFSEWGNRDVKSRNDTVFTVRVVNAYDPNEEKIVPEFTEYNQERLKKLKKMKTDLEQKLAAGIPAGQLGKN